MKLMHSTAKGKAQNVLRQRKSYANKKATMSGNEAMKCTQKEQLPCFPQRYTTCSAHPQVNFMNSLTYLLVVCCTTISIAIDQFVVVIYDTKKR